MERALFISKIKELENYKDSFSRIYFGNEFCERLIPSGRDLGFVLDFVERNSLDLTFVTPYVTEAGLDIVRPLLNELTGRRPESEVVFNDWGVFRILKNEYKDLEPVMGRLLTKIKRGPRLMNVLDQIPETAEEYFKSLNLTVPILRQFLSKNKIRRVDLDNPLQGINLDFVENDGINISLYTPFTYVTTTRFCLVGSSDIPEKRELIGILPCKKECQKYTFYLSNPVMPVTLIRKGNTIFFRNEKPPEDLEKISRIVIEPEIVL